MSTHRAWADWRAHFEATRRRPFPSLPDAVAPFPGGRELARSLARFQLGEAGEGRIAHQITRIELDGIDADYRGALQLFVAEEGRHARVLAGLVLALGGRLLTRHWTEAVFTRLRRLLGGTRPAAVRFKLLVLLVAEIIGLAFYRTLSPLLPRGPLRQATVQMCRDEAAHLRFHADFFALGTKAALPRIFWSGLLWAVVVGSGFVVLFDHAPALRLVTGGRARFVWLAWRLTGSALTRAGCSRASRAHRPRQVGGSHAGRDARPLGPKRQSWKPEGLMDLVHPLWRGGRPLLPVDRQALARAVFPKK
jgi:hypothetical protein